MKAWGERKSQGYQCRSYLKFWHFVCVASLHWLFFFRTIASKPDLIWLPSFLELPFGILFQTGNTPMGEWGSWNIYAPTLAAPGCPGCLKEPWHASLLWVQVRQLLSASGPLAVRDQALWLSKSYVDWRSISWNRILSGLWLMSTLRTQCICLFFSQGSYNFILVP